MVITRDKLIGVQFPISSTAPFELIVGSLNSVPRTRILLFDTPIPFLFIMVPKVGFIKFFLHLLFLLFSLCGSCKYRPLVLIVLPEIVALRVPKSSQANVGLYQIEVDVVQLCVVDER